jgi:alpha-L-arabinofuranosidase
MGKIVIKTQDELTDLGDLFGIFFEDLNHAADGGLYGELVRNRSFEFAPVDNASYHAMTAWQIRGEEGAKFCVITEQPLSEKNLHNLQVTVKNNLTGAALINEGFGSGIPVKAGERYYFSCYAKTEGTAPFSFTVALTDIEGTVIYDTKTCHVAGTQWKQYGLVLKPDDTDYSGRLVLTFPQTGTVYLDMVSLFPQRTFLSRQNGLREDIATMLKELKPKFMRFPGGCLVHDGQLDDKARDSMYRWKNTIGPLTERGARRNNWGYNQTLGLGYYEYFQFCEDIGTKPLPVLPAAYDPHHQRKVPLDELQPWIEDALDLIEFANGGIDTKWGGIRSALGHPKPFGLEYIGIGNEEVGEGFTERYPYFHKAIKEKYPDIKIIGTSGPFAAGSEYERGWNSAKENHADLVDEHYYMAPEWFLANLHRYDNFKQDEPKVFLGEFASWGNTWYNALTEAAYMTQLQNDAHAVGLVCYAPLLCNVDYVNWKPDMIWFNNHEVYGTPNYYVQKLFMHNQGDVLLKRSLEQLGDEKTTQADFSGDIQVFSVNGTASYKNITVTNHQDGTTLQLPDITVSGQRECKNVLGITGNHYTITMDVCEISGKNGFYMTFGKKAEGEYYAWELGGWQNLDAAITQTISGRTSCLTQSEFSVIQGETYHLKLIVDGNHIEGYINQKRIHDVMVNPIVIEPLYVTASKENATGDIILKVVNLQEEEVFTELDFSDSPRKLYQAKIETMSGYDLNAENSFAAPKNVVPKSSTMPLSANTFSYNFPKQSLTVLRLR